LDILQHHFSLAKITTTIFRNTKTF